MLPRLGHPTCMCPRSAIIIVNMWTEPQATMLNLLSLWTSSSCALCLQVRTHTGLEKTEPLWPWSRANEGLRFQVQLRWWHRVWAYMNLVLLRGQLSCLELLHYPSSTRWAVNALWPEQKANRSKLESKSGRTVHVSTDQHPPVIFWAISNAVVDCRVK